MLNVQADLISRLATHFSDAHVCAYTPDPIPERLITIRREGGRRLNRLLDRPGVGIHVWAGSESATCILADEVADFMQTLSFADGYSLVEQETMYSAPDPDTNRPRWYLSYTITTYDKEN